MGFKVGQKVVLTYRVETEKNSWYQAKLGGST